MSSSVGCIIPHIISKNNKCSKPPSSKSWSIWDDLGYHDLGNLHWQRKKKLRIQALWSHLHLSGHSLVRISMDLNLPMPSDFWSNHIQSILRTSWNNQSQAQHLPRTGRTQSFSAEFVPQALLVPPSNQKLKQIQKQDETWHGDGIHKRGINWQKTRLLLNESKPSSSFWTFDFTYFSGKQFSVQEDW